MQVIQKHLPVNQYFSKAFTKRNIVLHHTVSSTARSAMAWWAMTPERIGTAYIVDKDGVVYEMFPPECWAHHLGLRTPDNSVLNQQSIGIELVNEGPVWRGPAGDWRCLSGVNKPNGQAYTGAAPIEIEWRGYLAFAMYTDEQYEALNELIPMLRDQFKISDQVCTHFNFDKSAPDRYGIYHHANVRSDKSDLSPAFDWARLKVVANLKEV